MSKDNDALVIEIPATGLIPAAAEGDPPREEKTVPLHDEGISAKDAEISEALEKMRQERDAERSVREQRDREAAEARTTLENERKARADTEAKLSTVTDTAMRHEWATVNSEHQQLASALDNNKSETETAKEALRSYNLALHKAAADGNLELQHQYNNGVVAAQEKLANLAASRIALESGKSGAEEEIKRTERKIKDQIAARDAAALAAKEAKDKEPPATEAPRQQTPDEWIDTQRKVIGSRPADWLSEHKEFVTDPKLHKKLLAFAKSFPDLEDKPLDSEEFIEALNAKFFPEADAVDDPYEKPAAPAAKATPVKTNKGRASAPVNGQSGYFSSNNTRAEKIKLHPYLVQKAKELGYDPAEYGLFIKKGIDEGKMPKNYLDPDYPHGDN